mgnify:CR=1 FL=1
MSPDDVPPRITRRQFTIGGLSGVTHSIAPSDTQQTDTYYVVGHFHYVLFGGGVFGYVAGAYYWFPKWTGRFLDEKLGRWHFWLMLIGFNLTFLPSAVMAISLLVVAIMNLL